MTCHLTNVLRITRLLHSPGIWGGGGTTLATAYSLAVVGRTGNISTWKVLGLWEVSDSLCGIGHCPRALLDCSSTAHGVLLGYLQFRSVDHEKHDKSSASCQFC